MKRLIAILCLLVCVGCGGGTGEADSSNSSSSSEGKKPKIAFVTNGIASFWNVAEAGVKHAARDFDCEAIVKMPATDPLVSDQRRMLEELVTLGIDGVAVSPIDPANQQDILKLVAENALLITHDSDAPQAPRRVYVGMSNYKAGRMCGQLVKEAMPAGGSIMIFVGRMEQLNARQRRQGLIDELLDRSQDETRSDPTGEVIRGDKYTILGTRTDNFDRVAAKAAAEDALTANPELGCMVGLFAYNPPAILEALKTTGSLGKVQVIGFDEDFATLSAIQAGHCYGTVVQDPFRYGYDSVRILAGLIRGDESVLPEGEFLDIPARQIRRDNVQAFREDLEKKIAEGSGGSPSSEGESADANGDSESSQSP